MPVEPAHDVEGLYRAHGQRVARWVQRLAGPSVDVEDLVHEVFLIVQRKLGGFRGEAKVTTWLYRITEHVVRHHRRRERVRRWFGGSAEGAADLLRKLGPAPGLGPTAERRIAERLADADRPARRRVVPWLVTGAAAAALCAALLVLRARPPAPRECASEGACAVRIALVGGT